MLEKLTFYYFFSKTENFLEKSSLVLGEWTLNKLHQQSNVIKFYSFDLLAERKRKVLSQHSVFQSANLQKTVYFELQYSLYVASISQIFRQ